MTGAFGFALAILGTTAATVPIDVTPIGGKQYYAAMIKGNKNASSTRVRLCPSPSEPPCPKRPYVVPGDIVLVIEMDGRNFQVVYVDRAGNPSDGFVNGDVLRPLAQQAGAKPNWIGIWEVGENQIAIERSRDPRYLVAEGNATFGLYDPWRMKHSGPSLGDFTVKFRPDGDFAAFADGSPEDREPGPLIRNWRGELGKTLAYTGKRKWNCEVKMRRISIYLVADDNGLCGGHQVSFGGIYRRVDD